MNIIKINEQVFEGILGGNDDWNIDFQHLPFEKFIIAFPYEFFRTSEEMFEDSMKSAKEQANKQGLTLEKAIEGKEKQFKKAKKKIDDYARADLHVIISKQKAIGNREDIVYTVKHSQPQIIGKDEILFKGRVGFGFLPIVEKNEVASNGIWYLGTLIRLTMGVTHYLNQPITYEKMEKVEKVEKKSKKGKKGINRGNVRYIRRTIYNMNTVGERPSREYSRHMESWQVRGHWRYYKSGKKVWIESYTKGHNNKEEVEGITYKITNLGK